MSDYSWYNRSREYEYGDYKIIDGKGMYYNEDSNKWVNRLNKKIVKEKYKYDIRNYQRARSKGNSNTIE